MKSITVVILFVFVAASTPAKVSGIGHKFDREKCLNDGGVTKNDLNQILDDIYFEKWLDLAKSKKTMCFVTCTIYDKVPKIRIPLLSKLIEVISKALDCKLNTGDNVCGDLSDYLLCIGSGIATKFIMFVPS